MKRIEIISHQGKAILYCDFTNLTILPKSALQELMNQAKDFIITQPPQSILALTDMTGLYVNDDIIAIFPEYISHNKTYIKASAIIGFPDTLKNILEDLQQTTEREFHLFDSKPEALDWLAEQS